MICNFCNKQFQPKSLGNANKFCSSECYWNSKKGGGIYICVQCRKNFKLNGTERGYGKGKFCSYECYWKNKENITGEDHPNWKGDKVGMSGLHAWVKKQFGNVKECSYCSSEENIEWANVSHEYKRELDDWMPLCSKCHFYYDKQDLRQRGYHGKFI